MNKRSLIAVFSPFRKLLSIQFDPISACNLKCEMCNSRQWHTNNKFPQEKIDSLISMIKEMNIKSITIGASAEPLIHPHIDKILDKLYEVDIGVKILSNLNTKKKKIIEKLKRVNMISTSIDGDSETYPLIRKGGNWDLIINNIKELSKDTIITVDMVVLKNNFHTIPSIVEALNSVNGGKIQELNIKLPVFFLRNRDLDLDTFKQHIFGVDKIDEFMSLIDYANKIASFKVNYEFSKEETLDVIKTGLRNDFGSFPCIEFLHTVYISPEGKVQTCCMGAESDISIGNVTEDTLKNIIKGKKYTKLRNNLLNLGYDKKPKYCKACPMVSNKKTYDRFLKYHINGIAIKYLKKI